MSQEYMTTKEASELLGVARRTITKWCENEKLPFVQRLGWIWLINKPKLLKWLQENEKDINPVYKLPRCKKNRRGGETECQLSQTKNGKPIILKHTQKKK